MDNPEWWNDQQCKAEWWRMSMMFNLDTFSINTSQKKIEETWNHPSQHVFEFSCFRLWFLFCSKGCYTNLTSSQPRLVHPHLAVMRSVVRSCAPGEGVTCHRKTSKWFDMGWTLGDIKHNVNDDIQPPNIYIIQNKQKNWSAVFFFKKHVTLYTPFQPDKMNLESENQTYKTARFCSDAAPGVGLMFKICLGLIFVGMFAGNSSWFRKLFNMGTFSTQSDPGVSIVSGFSRALSGVDIIWFCVILELHRTASNEGSINWRPHHLRHSGWISWIMQFQTLTHPSCSGASTRPLKHPCVKGIVTSCHTKKGDPTAKPAGLQPKSRAISKD